MVTTAEPIPEASEHLVARSRAGDEVAFASLVRAYQAAVFGTVLRLVRDREVAADVSNRAFSSRPISISRATTSRDHSAPGCCASQPTRR